MANNVSQIELPKSSLNQIISDSIAASGLSNLVGVVRTTSTRDSYAYNFSGQHGAFHADASVDKDITNTNISLVNVPMTPLYTTLLLPNTIESEEEEIALQLQREAPVTLGKTLEDAILGGTDAVATSPFSNVFGAPTNVDLTDPVALGALADSTSSDFTGWLFNSAAKSSLKTAITKGTNVNPLTFGLNNGVLISGQPAYFSKVGLPLTKIAGVVGDFSKAILVVNDSLSISRVTGETSWDLALKNAIGYKLEWHVGFAIAEPAAFKAFKTAA